MACATVLQGHDLMKKKEKVACKSCASAAGQGLCTTKHLLPSLLSVNQQKCALELAPAKKKTPASVGFWLEAFKMSLSDLEEQSTFWCALKEMPGRN